LGGPEFFERHLATSQFVKYGDVCEHRDAQASQ
jgi:hypothetical protein